MSREQAVKDVSMLWPYIGFLERLALVEKIANAYDGSRNRWPEVVKEIVWQVGLNHWLQDGWLEQDYEAKGSFYRSRWNLEEDL